MHFSRISEHRWCSIPYFYEIEDSSYHRVSNTPFQVWSPGGALLGSYKTFEDAKESIEREYA